MRTKAGKTHETPKNMPYGQLLWGKTDAQKRAYVAEAMLKIFGKEHLLPALTFLNDSPAWQKSRLLDYWRPENVTRLENELHLLSLVKNNLSKSTQAEEIFRWSIFTSRVLSAVEIYNHLSNQRYADFNAPLADRRKLDKGSKQNINMLDNTIARIWVNLFSGKKNSVPLLQKDIPQNYFVFGKGKYVSAVDVLSPLIDLKGCIESLSKKDSKRGRAKDSFKNALCHEAVDLLYVWTGVQPKKSHPKGTSKLPFHRYIDFVFDLYEGERVSRNSYHFKAYAFDAQKEELDALQVTGLVTKI